MALFVMDEPQVGPDRRDADLVGRRLGHAAARCRGRGGRLVDAAVVLVDPPVVLVVVGAAVVEVVLAELELVEFPVSFSMACCTLWSIVACCDAESLFRSDWTFNVCLLPVPRSSTVGSISPVPGQGIGGLGLGDVGGRNRPFGPALELDAEVETAAQDDRDDPGDDDDRREGEPDAPPADEVEAGLTPVEAGDRAMALAGAWPGGSGRRRRARRARPRRGPRCRRPPRTPRPPPRARRRGSCRSSSGPLSRGLTSHLRRWHRSARRRTSRGPAGRRSSPVLMLKTPEPWSRSL